jgi:hypothetical protein
MKFYAGRDGWGIHMSTQGVALGWGDIALAGRRKSMLIKNLRSYKY